MGTKSRETIYGSSVRAAAARMPRGMGTHPRGLTDQDIATARRYSENSAAALARYDERRRGDDGEK
jgi:hypothetical protein